MLPYRAYKFILYIPDLSFLDLRRRIYSYLEQLLRKSTERESTEGKRTRGTEGRIKAPSKTPNCNIRVKRFRKTRGTSKNRFQIRAAHSRFFDGICATWHSVKIRGISVFSFPHFFIFSSYGIFPVNCTTILSYARLAPHPSLYFA